MNIPNYPNSPMTDGKGNITPEWQNTITQLLTELQLNLSNEGYRLPQLATTQINDLTDVGKSTGNMVYDNTTNQFKVNIEGTWRVVTVI